MAEEERRQMAQQATSTLGRNLAVGGFGNPMTYTPPERPSPFAGTAEQFARIPEQAAAPNIPLGNTIPAFPDNYNQAMTDRSRAQPTSDFGIYGSAAQLGSGQTPPMAPVTNAISSFANPLASRTERIESQYGTASTTLTPDQQVMRAQARQQAEQAGTMPRTPEQQQALLAQIRQTGAGIRQRIAEQNIRPTPEATKRYYAFREQQEQGRFREAMSQAEREQARGGSGRDAMARAEQARFGAEIQRQAGANVGTGQRTPMFSWETAQMPSGEQFYRGSMGTYSPVVGTSRPRTTASAQAPQPASPTFNLFSQMPSLQFPQSQPSGLLREDMFNTFPYRSMLGS